MYQSLSLVTQVTNTCSKTIWTVCSTVENCAVYLALKRIAEHDQQPHQKTQIIGKKKKKSPKNIHLTRDSNPKPSDNYTVENCAVYLANNEKFRCSLCALLAQWLARQTSILAPCYFARNASDMLGLQYSYLKVSGSSPE